MAAWCWLAWSSSSAGSSSPKTWLSMSSSISGRRFRTAHERQQAHPALVSAGVRGRATPPPRRPLPDPGPLRHPAGGPGLLGGGHDGVLRRRSAARPGHALVGLALAATADPSAG